MCFVNSDWANYQVEYRIQQIYQTKLRFEGSWLRTLGFSVKRIFLRALSTFHPSLASVRAVEGKGADALKNVMFKVDRPIPKHPPNAVS
jgi:hypothetical protein